MPLEGVGKGRLLTWQYLKASDRSSIVLFRRAAKESHGNTAEKRVM